MNFLDKFIRDIFTGLCALTITFRRRRKGLKLLFFNFVNKVEIYYKKSYINQ